MSVISLRDQLQILESNQDKFDLVESIIKLHPGHGTRLGWSWYIGGMSDTGGWYAFELLLQPIEKLQKCYLEWTWHLR